MTACTLHVKCFPGIKNISGLNDLSSLNNVNYSMLLMQKKIWSGVVIQHLDRTLAGNKLNSILTNLNTKLAIFFSVFGFIPYVFGQPKQPSVFRADK